LTRKTVSLLKLTLGGKKNQGKEGIDGQGSIEGPGYVRTNRGGRPSTGVYGQLMRLRKGPSDLEGGVS